MNKYLVGLAALIAATSSHAASLVQDGGFEAVTPMPNIFVNFTGLLTNWSVSPGGFLAVYGPGGADTVGALRTPGHTYGLWGPANGVLNGLPASSPDGGNFVGSDGDTFFAVALSQTISGLVVGHEYVLNFDWAAAQLRDFDCAGCAFNGPTTDTWKVSLGSQTFSTPVASIAEHGFSGWRAQSFTYTATSASEVLTFLAQGTPHFNPPFALLDGVSLNDAAVPEPAAWAMMLIGVGGLGGVARRRRVATLAV